MRDEYTKMRAAVNSLKARERKRLAKEAAEGDEWAKLCLRTADDNLFIPNNIVRNFKQFSSRSNKAAGVMLLLAEMLNKQLTNNLHERKHDGWFPVPTDSAGEYAQMSGRKLTDYLDRLEELGLIEKRLSGFPATREVRLLYGNIVMFGSGRLLRTGVRRHVG